MITYFNIPPGSSISMPISKKLFAEKAPLSATEKRLLREEVDRLTMRGLLQTRTIGLNTYVDEEYAYDQIVIAEVSIKKQSKASAVANMIQKAFPAPMILVIHCGEYDCVNWCVKRINQADKTRRVMEEQQITRFFAPESKDGIVRAWLASLDITRMPCNSLKELFEALANRLMMLEVSDQAGVFIESGRLDMEQYRTVLEQLAANRTNQKQIANEIKAETQFNMRLKLTTKLKELQQQEETLKSKII